MKQRRMAKASLLDQAKGSGLKQTNIAQGSGIGRTESTGTWKGFHGPRIHTKEQCVALNRKNSKYEYMWRDCTNDIDIEPVDPGLLISVKDLGDRELTDENYVIKSGRSKDYYHRN